jgi:DNA-binding response OmpR family regulator
MPRISAMEPRAKLPQEIDLPLVVPQRPSEMPWTLDVLAVDDDPADTMLVTEALRSNPRVRNITTTDAPQNAISALVAGALRPDLILVDVAMPRVNGFKFISAIREAPWMARIPIALLTSSPYGQDVDLARRMGILNYIVKPRSFREMQFRINTLIDQLVVGA